MAQAVKNLPAGDKESAGDPSSIPGLGLSPGEGNGNPPIHLPREFHGQRCLAYYSPWGSHRVEHDWTTDFHFQSVIFLYIPHCLSYIYSTSFLSKFYSSLGSFLKSCLLEDSDFQNVITAPMSSLCRCLPHC